MSDKTLEKPLGELYNLLSTQQEQNKPAEAPWGRSGDSKVEKVKTICLKISGIIGTGNNDNNEGYWYQADYHANKLYSEGEIVPLAAYHLQQVATDNDVYAHAKTALALLSCAADKGLIGGRRRQSRRQSRQRQSRRQSRQRQSQRQSRRRQ